MRTYRLFWDNRYTVDGVPLSELERDYPLALMTVGIPTRFAFVTDSNVRFNFYPGTTTTDLMRVEYDYLYKPADLTNDPTEEPLVPYQYRRILADLAAAWLCTDKNDTRATTYGNTAKALLDSMKQENIHRWASMARSYGKIFPRQAQLPEYRMPIRTQTGLIIG